MELIEKSIHNPTPYLEPLLMHLLNTPAEENRGSAWVVFSFCFYVTVVWQLVTLENKQDDKCLTAEGRKKEFIRAGILPLPYPVHIISVTHHNWKFRQQLFFTQHKDIQITSIK